MSAFTARCPNCGEVYFHCFVGMTLVSGHHCKKPKPHTSGWPDRTPSDQEWIKAQKRALS